MCGEFFEIISLTASRSSGTLIELVGRILCLKPFWRSCASSTVKFVLEELMNLSKNL